MAVRADGPEVPDRVNSILLTDPGQRHEMVDMDQSSRDGAVAFSEVNPAYETLVP